MTVNIQSFVLRSGSVAGFWVIRCNICGTNIAASVYAGKTSRHARRNLVCAARRRGWDTTRDMCPDCRQEERGRSAR